MDNTKAGLHASSHEKKIARYTPTHGHASMAIGTFFCIFLEERHGKARQPAITRRAISKKLGLRDYHGGGVSQKKLSEILISKQT